MLTTWGFPFSYTAFTTVKAGANFQIILTDPAQYDLYLSQLPEIIRGLKNHTQSPTLYWLNRGL